MQAFVDERGSQHQGQDSTSHFSLCCSQSSGLVIDSRMPPSIRRWFRFQAVWLQ